MITMWFFFLLVFNFKNTKYCISNSRRKKKISIHKICSDHSVQTYCIASLEELDSFIKNFNSIRFPRNYRSSSS